MKTRQQYGVTMKIARVFLITKRYMFKKLNLLIKSLFFSLLLTTSVNATTAQEHLATYNVSMQIARDFIMDNHATNLDTVYNICLEFHVNNDMIAEILASDFPGLTGKVVSVYFDSYGFTGSGLGFAPLTVKNLLVSYPENSEVLMHFTLDTNSSVVDYIARNDEGERKWSGVVNKRVFDVTMVDYLPTKVSLDDTYATFTYNADDTVNYKIYTDTNQLLDEKSNVVMSVAENNISSRASLADCEVKKQDITLLYKAVVLRANKLKELDIEDYDRCIDNSYGSYSSKTRKDCEKDYEDTYQSVKDYVMDLLIWAPGLGTLVDDYKKECTVVDNLIEVPDEASEATECHSIGTGSFWLGDSQLGNYCQYFNNGQLEKEIPYVNGLIHGIVRHYDYSNGNIRITSVVWNGVRNGPLKTYSSSGELIRCRLYEDGKYGASCMP